MGIPCSFLWAHDSPQTLTQEITWNYGLHMGSLIWNKPNSKLQFTTVKLHTINFLRKPTWNSMFCLKDFIYCMNGAADRAFCYHLNLFSLVFHSLLNTKHLSNRYGYKDVLMWPLTRCFLCGVDLGSDQSPDITQLCLTVEATALPSMITVLEYLRSNISV